MYTININTHKYDINLLSKKFGKKAERLLKKNRDKTDLTQLGIKMRNFFESYPLESPVLLWVS